MIDIKLVPRIEKALGFKLYPMVIRYLTTDDVCHWYGRVCGKTTAYILRLALQKDRTIDWRSLRQGKYVDEVHGTSYPGWFAHEFIHVKDLLSIERLEVIKINNK